jgi:NADP-dependent 3-hydroxy acid dehydrogenase YdfG
MLPIAIAAVDLCLLALFAGLKVVAVARRKERLEALQSRMSALGVPMTHFLPVVCDITKDAEVS